MIRKTLLAALSAVSLSVVATAEGEPPLKIHADIVQASPFSETLVASGNVVAVRGPFRMTSPGLSRDADDVYRFENPTMFTTCTNEIGHLHWHVKGAFEFKDGSYACLRDGWIHFWEIPVFWVPYLAFPTAGQEGLRVMPGYISRWGAYIMSKYVYHIIGSRYEEDPEGWGLDGNTRVDFREKQKLALGETLEWRLGGFGTGKFKVYYAWDRSDSYDFGHGDDWHHENWGSDIPDERYAMELRHRWDITERDLLRLSGAIYSDSYFRYDFFRRSLFMLKNQFLGYDSNEVAWEHIENWAGFGVSVCGPLNDFVGGTCRIPELYIDINPTPVFGLPVNYETENRFGCLKRVPAHYGDPDAEVNAYNRVPGPWAEYETFRIDTYHRLTAPMKFADALSVVPRIAYRGTFWGDTGNTCLTGWETAQNVCENVYRSILEGGVTFSARGTAEIGGGWRHMVEPYLDVLAQKAWYTGLDDGSRPFVFDALDASIDWSDQFASRGRNLPYSWYGFTPGVRNVLDLADENGRFRRVLDFDLYVAVQCEDTEWIGEDRSHKLAEPGRPNYGKRRITPVPGFRLGWRPIEAASLSARFEYDADENVAALGSLLWRHRLCDGLSYFVNLYHTDFRRWDFASSPYDARTMESDELNLVRFTFVHAGFEHELCSALAWSPYVRWDCLDNQLDSAGAWFEYRTDCLGFRFILEYDNEYTRIDGSKREEDWSTGFFVYLRAFGSDAGSVFMQ